MLDRLPVFIDPLSFSERGKILSGTIEISELARLCKELLDDSGLVNLNASFYKEGRLSVIEGDITANLVLECQSCLNPMRLDVDRHFKLGVVNSIEQADSLASDCEPLMAENEKVSLIELVEDELLLALPDFPRHEQHCVEELSVSLDDSNNNDDEQLNSDNPFSVLAKLKNTGD